MSAPKLTGLIKENSNELSNSNQNVAKPMIMNSSILAMQASSMPITPANLPAKKGLLNFHKTYDKEEEKSIKPNKYAAALGLRS